MQPIRRTPWFRAIKRSNINQITISQKICYRNRPFKVRTIGYSSLEGRVNYSIKKAK